MQSSVSDLWGQKEKNRSGQVPRVFHQQGENGVCYKHSFDQIQKYCFREQRLLSVSSAPACFQCRYTTHLGEDGTETVSFISPALITRLSYKRWMASLPQPFAVLWDAGLCFVAVALPSASP